MLIAFSPQPHYNMNMIKTNSNRSITSRVLVILSTINTVWLILAIGSVLIHGGNIASGNNPLIVLVALVSLIVLIGGLVQELNRKWMGTLVFIAHWLTLVVLTLTSAALILLSVASVLNADPIIAKWTSLILLPIGIIGLVLTYYFATKNQNLRPILIIWSWIWTIWLILTAISMLNSSNYFAFLMPITVLASLTIIPSTLFIWARQFHLENS